MADRGRGRGRGQRGYRGQRGSERGRGSSTGGNTMTNPPICFEFRNTGICNRANCRFSHAGAEQQSTQAGNIQTRVAETDEHRQARQSYNAWKRHLGSDPNDARTMQRLWEGSFKILEGGDRDQKQQLPKDLDTDDKYHKGRHHIDALMSIRVRNGECNHFFSNCQRFLLTITHPSLLESLVVDTYVGSIYNFVSGANGTRAIPFLQHLCENLVDAHLKDRPSSCPKLIESTLVAMSVALREMLKRESRARFNNDLKALVDLLETAAEGLQSKESSMSSIVVINHVRYIRDIVARAEGLLATEVAPKDTLMSPSPNKSAYPRDLVIPSDRHDNDKLDITEIVIFPTRDEIMSDAKEVLPFTDPDQPHFLSDPVQRHIDTHFRLFRHDIFGQLKGALADLMHTISHDETVIENVNSKLGDVQAYGYSGAQISHVGFRKTLEAYVSFTPPPTISKKTIAEQRKWLEESRRLEKGSLLSFIWVQEGLVQHVFLTLLGKDAKDIDKSLNHSQERIMISTRLMTQDRATMELLMGANASQSRGVLLEFPRIMPSTFVPILENLQSTQRLGDMPFRDWIVPARRNGISGAKVYHSMPPPVYAQRAGFRFPLKTITTSSGECLHVDPKASCNDSDLLNQLQKNTTLDRGQCRALVAALTRAFAFIQGPPGTGKSYLGVQLMRVLLDIKSKVKLGPILVVCYTNHALDQFLEHLIDVGVTKIIRVGGQSKSTALANHNLQHLRKSETNTRTEKSLVWKAYSKIEDYQGSADEILHDLRQLHRRREWDSLKTHICEEYNDIYRQFREVDDEGFQLVGRHPFDLWCASYDNFPVDPLRMLSTQTELLINNIIQRAERNVHSLNHFERRVLIDHWIQEAHKVKIEELFEVVDSAASAQQELDNIHAEASLRILQGADVIGITTSGLAGRISALKRVPSKILVCEEAGEILEPHMISALLPTIEHCIQIGDHEQLRPSISNFDDLSLESQRGVLHQLDRSQFERLSIGEADRPLVPVAQLNVQRRMRPQISTLIRETIYEKLIDHGSTIDLPDVVGIRNNVFWLDHSNLEGDPKADSQQNRSKSNSWEVRMVQALVRHVVRQGTYKSSEIAVLTPYTGQLQKLRAALRSDFEIVISDRDQEALEQDGFKADDSHEEDERVTAAQEHGRQPLQKKQLLELLRVATVDNFQGEEAKVVIVSLVRSNKKRNVGFLKTTNRINVLLSRAKHGLYLIGNSDTYSTVKMWQKVINMLVESDSFGQSLGLCCPRHPEKIMEVEEPDDFTKFSPEGGCREACVDRLDCGHSCQARCHSQAMHNVFQCEEPCQRRHQPCDHPCQKQTCGEPCGNCMIKINNVQLPCGHTHNHVKCHLTLDLPKIPCHLPTSKQVPNCRHIVTVKCSQDVTKPNFKCPTPCGTILPCGHVCPGACGVCNGKDDEGQLVVKHLSCTQKCRRKMGTCNHACDRLCHDGSDCGLCQKPCEVRCKHSKCPRKCHEPCAPCIRDCAWFCEHQGACTMPCSAPCNRLPCDERCTRLLPCGHQCPSICGEDCPLNCCQQCGMKADEQPDMLEMKSYSEIDLDESPIVALGCGHIFTIETLDGIIDLKEVYEQNSLTGRFVSLIENAQLAVEVPKCPNCRSPIRQFVTQRYNRLINKAVIDEMTKRFIVSGQQELQGVEDKIKVVGAALEESRQSAIPEFTIPNDPIVKERVVERAKYFLCKALEKRYNGVRSLGKIIQAFQKRTDTQHQPAGKLHQAILHASRKNIPLEDILSGLSLGRSVTSGQHSSDQRIKQGGSLASIKIQALGLEDKFDLYATVKDKFPVGTAMPEPSGGPLVKQAESFLNSCSRLIEDCDKGKLPKFFVEATLYYSRISQSLNSSGFATDDDRKKIEDYRETAKALLEKATKLCEQQFQGAELLADAVERSLKLLRSVFYQDVTKEEIEAIKKAMVSGPRGIATHSGHWYNCENGHPFAIGECGMPMERARCPECGAPVGGQNHAPVEGITRATEME